MGIAQVNNTTYLCSTERRWQSHVCPSCLLISLTQELVTGDLCELMECVLDRVHWLFQQRGCFLIDGHTSYAIEWLKKRRFFMVKATVSNTHTRRCSVGPAP